MNPAGFSEQVQAGMGDCKEGYPHLLLQGSRPHFRGLHAGLPVPCLLHGQQAAPPVISHFRTCRDDTLFHCHCRISCHLPVGGSAKTLERLASCPITVEAIVFGDMIASILFGIGITFVTVIIGLALGLSLLHGILLLAAIFLAACCFSAIGMLLAVPPTNVPSNIMMLSSLIKFPLVFISGIFIPLEQMPSWGLVLAVFSPLTYFTDLVRYSFTGDHYLPGADRYRCTCCVYAGVHRWDDVPAQEDHATENVTG